MKQSWNDYVEGRLAIGGCGLTLLIIGFVIAVIIIALNNFFNNFSVGKLIILIIFVLMIIGVIVNTIIDYKASEEKTKTRNERKVHIKGKRAKEEAKRLEAERITEEERIAKEKAKKKKRKTIIGIVASVACIAITFIVVLNTVIIPTIKRNDEIARMDSKYDNAVALSEEGKYCDAYKALIALNGYKDSVEKSQSIYNQCVTESLTKAQAGNYVYFGTYEQDNDSSNGNEFIEWIVLEIKDSKALVISKYALDCLQYDPEFDSVTWEQCNLRKWLNDNFINSAFTLDEIKKVVTSRVPADQNPYYNPKPGNPTQDKVFLLSLTEVEKYFKEENDRVCDATEYAYNQGAHRYSGGCEWWLRTPGDYTSWAATVTFEGGVTHQGDRVDSVENAVRPAMWIDLSKID